MDATLPISRLPHQAAFAQTSKKTIEFWAPEETTASTRFRCAKAKRKIALSGSAFLLTIYMKAITLI